MICHVILALALLCQPADTSESPSCYAAGRQEGEDFRARGSALGGFFCGLAGGPLGTAIAVIAQSPKAPYLESLDRMEDRECREDFREGFREATLGKKRTAAIAGGVVGTIALGVVVALIAD